MPVNNVSNFALFQSTLSDVNKLITQLADAQTQLSSGFKSQTYAGVASESQELVSLKSSIAKTDQYINDSKVLEARINSTSSALGQLIETGTALQNLISQRRTGVATSGAFAVQVRGMWQQIVGQLNTSIDGQYLFSGTRTDMPAVSDETFPTLQTSGVADTGYYQGSAEDMTVRIDDNITMTYNIRADNEGIQKLYAGLAMAMDGDATSSDDKLAAAYDMVREGLQGVITAQSQVNANKVQLSQVTQNHQTIKLYWQGLKESIANTDVLTVSTQVAQNQGILQAAFQAFAKINSLRLSDFLR